MTEFTGERVIPGYVNDDLWAEHVARYAFAARFAQGRTLDSGCGTGYGTAMLAASFEELARTTEPGSAQMARVTDDLEGRAGPVRASTWVAGIDIAPEAIAYARENYAAPNVAYAQASASCLPFQSGSFDLVTAFEVIEHLADWPDLLRETRRVLASSGLLLVSTPNRLYYAESRKLEGPNPYHVHEFEFAEFQAALREHFPNVGILFQNRVEAFSFHRPPHDATADVRLESSSKDPGSAHFFLAVCSCGPLPPLPPFVYVPRAANVLREREQHIQLLLQELRQTKQWLEQSIVDLNSLQRAHEQQTLHLAEQNHWALDLENQLKAAQDRIVELQQEAVEQQARATAVADGYKRKVAELEQENREKTAWAMDTETRLTADLAARAQEFAATVRLLEAAEQTVIERTRWAQGLDAELTQLRTQLAMIRQSRWIKAGRRIGLGPRVD